MRNLGLLATACVSFLLSHPGAQPPAAAPRPVFAFVGLHGGVFKALQEQGRDLPVQVEYLLDEKIAAREIDLSRYRLVFVQHLREESGPVLAEMLLAAQRQGPGLRMFALSGGGSSGRARQLTDKAEHKGLLERDANVQAYYGSSPENLRRLLIYALATFCGTAIEVLPPLPAPAIGVFHPDRGQIVDLPAFEEFLRTRGGDFATRPRVAVIAHNIHLQLQQPAVVEALIRGLEARGLTACAVLDTGEGLAAMRPQYEALLLALKPEVAIHTCHSVDTLPFREQLDIPHLHSIFFRRQSIAEWHDDPQGLDAHEIAFQIATQETLGAIEPQIGSGTEHGGGSEEAMTPIPERIDHLVRRTCALVELRRTANAKKRVAVLYWNSGMDKRGLARGTATGMFLNAPQSLVVVLQRMQQEGYTLANPPKDEDSLIAAMLERGRQLPPHDAAGLAEMVRVGHPALIPVARFAAWLDKRVPAAARKKLTERWGPPPGRFMVWRSDQGEEFLVVPHLDFGNVVLLPQALRGEFNDSAAIHDKLSAPPYNYLATYFWLQEEWHAQAMVHFGTHGSEIALPGKANGLCDQDWTDICMGDLPNVYPWTVENLGEAVLAKRRAYGVLIGHLPPPVENAGITDALKTLHDDLEKWAGLEAGALKERFRAEVSGQARQLRIDQDLGAAFPASGPLDAALLTRIDDYLHGILEEPIPTSLHTLGEVPTDQQLVPHLVTCLHKAFLERLRPLFPGAAEGGHSEHLRGKAEAVLRLVAVDGLADKEALQRAGAQLPDTGVPEALVADLATARQLRAGYQQTGNELTGLMEALAGRFVTPGPGRGPDRNPAVLPTGRNLYLLNQDEVPSRASWELGKALGDELLTSYQNQHGRLPEKVAFALSSHATFQDFGVMESQILRLIGVEPVWNERGLVKEVRVLSRAELKRPRVDVLIQGGGRYYSCLPSRMELLDQALRQVQALVENDNGVRRGTDTMLAEMRKRGLPVEAARRLAAARIFGVNLSGNAGGSAAKFSALVERSADWDTRDELIEAWLDRPHAAFVDGDFVEAPRAAFETALRGTDVVLRTWYRSTSSPLSNRYDWLVGGTLAAAVEHVTGKRPEFRLVDVRDPDRASNVDAGLAARRDFRVRLFNRKWIEGMQKEGYAGADQVAVAIGNAFGWETMQKGTVTAELWNEIKSVYLDDALKLGIEEWFARENPWAQQAVASVLLDAARKGFWAADAKTLAEVATKYFELVQKHGSGGGLRDAGSGKIRAFAEQALAKHAGVATAPLAQPGPVNAAGPAGAKAGVESPAESPAGKPPVPPVRAVVEGQRLEAGRTPPAVPPAPSPVTPEPPSAPWLPWLLAAGVVALFVFGLTRKPVI